MDRLESLQAFVSAVDRGSLSAAARALGRSAASVTRAVAELEERLGAVLLRRTTRSQRLTEVGERYVLVARRVLADLEDAEASARAARTLPAGLLRVTAPASFGTLHVRPIVARYLQTYPDVRVQLLLLDRVVNIVDEGIDVAVRIGHLPDSALVATLVGTVRRVVVASPGYLSRHGKPASPASLATHRIVSYSGVTPSDTWAFGSGRRRERAQQVKVRPVLSVNAAEAAVGAAAGGCGLACCLSYQVADALRGGSVVRVLSAFEPPPVPIHLVHPGMSGSTAKVRAFTEVAAPLLRDALARVERSLA